MNALFAFSKANRFTIQAVLFVAFILILGHDIPEPALSYFRFGQAVKPIWHSIYWQGIPIWTEIILAVEAYLLVDKWLKKVPPHHFKHANPFNPYIVCAAMIFTFISTFFEWKTILNFVERGQEIETYSLISAALVSVGGVSLAILLGQIIDKIWTGYGFWCVYILNYQNDIANQLIKYLFFPLAQLKTLLSQQLAIIAVISILLVVVFLLQFHRKASQGDWLSIIFLSILPPYVSGWLYKFIQWVYWYAGNVDLFDASKGQPWFLSNWQEFYFVTEIILTILLGSFLSFRGVDRAIKLVYIIAMLARLLLIHFLNRSQIRLSLLDGPDLLVAAYATLEIHDHWIEFCRTQKIKATLRRRKTI